MNFGRGVERGKSSSEGVLTAERVKGKLARSFQEPFVMSLSTFEQVQLMLSAEQRDSLGKVQAALEENPQCLEKSKKEKEDA